VEFVEKRAGEVQNEQVQVEEGPEGRQGEEGSQANPGGGRESPRVIPPDINADVSVTYIRYFPLLIGFTALKSDLAFYTGD
jgi:hypothetical protein